MKRLGLLVVVAVAAACSGGSEGASEPELREAPAGAIAHDVLYVHPDDAVIIGLEVDGAGPTLWWDAYEGAAGYEVIALSDRDPAGPWIWIGSETSVEFGAVDLPTVDGDEPVDFAREVHGERRVPVSGATYVWTVTAIDVAGTPVATSKAARFTAQ